MKKAVVVITAHAFEARAAAGMGRSMSKEPWGQWRLDRGEMWGRPLSVIRCGPGKVAAAAATQAAIQYLDPVVLVSFGAGSTVGNVEKVTVSLTAETEKTDPQTGEFRTVDMVSEIALRNFLN